MAKRRQKLRKKYSKKLFTRGAQKVHQKNSLQNKVMRGGIRL